MGGRGFPAGTRLKADHELKGKYRRTNGQQVARLIVERRIGMTLPPGAIVHHVSPDDTLTNNGPFVVCENTAYHALLEVRGRALRACGNANWRKCWKCGEYDDSKNLIITSVPSYPERDMVRHKQFRWKCVAIDFDTYGRRLPKARTEGIWEAIGETQVRCVICGKEQNTSTFARAGHGEKHVREGSATVRLVPGILARKGSRKLYEPSPGFVRVLIQHVSSPEETNNG